MFRALVSGLVVLSLAGAISADPAVSTLANSRISDTVVGSTADTAVPGSPVTEPARTNAITRMHKYANEPVSVVGVQVRGRSFESGDLPAVFQDTSGWLKGMTVRFKNVSDKPISSLELHVTANNPNKPGNLIDFTLKFGDDPGPNRPEGAAVLAPGQMAELSISDAWYARAERVLKTNGSPSLSKIQTVDIEVGYVHFDDGTAWHAGDFLQPDPDHAGNYIVVEKQGL
jgi:hypothetical protein